MPNRGYIQLINLKEGDSILVNGRPNLCTLSDNELIRLYNELELSPLEISNNYAIPYRTIITKLKTLGIFIKRKK